MPSLDPEGIDPDLITALGEAMDKCPACGTGVTNPLTQRQLTRVSNLSGVTYEIHACSLACTEKITLMRDVWRTDEILTGFVRLARSIPTNVYPLDILEKQVKVEGRQPTLFTDELKPKPLLGVQAMAYAMQALHDKQEREAREGNARMAKRRAAVDSFLGHMKEGRLDAFLAEIQNSLLDRHDFLMTEDLFSPEADKIVTAIDQWKKEREEW